VDSGQKVKNTPIAWAGFSCFTVGLGNREPLSLFSQSIRILYGGVATFLYRV